MKLDELKKLIQEVVNAALDEKAKTPGEAGQARLALHTAVDYGVRSIVLYDPHQLLATLEKEYDPEWGGGSIFNAYDALKSIKAFITIERPPEGNMNNANAVGLAAAEHGYGPLIYDVAMGIGGEIAASRDSVSRSARKVWKYYFNNRADVNKKPIDNIYHPRTKTKKDDGEIVGHDAAPPHDDVYWDSPTAVSDKPAKYLKDPLNWTYSLKKAPATTRLLNNNEKFFKVAKQKFKGVTKGELKDFLDSAGEDFFRRKYRS